MRKKKTKRKSRAALFSLNSLFFSPEKNKENKEARLFLFVFFRVKKNKEFKENKAARLYLFVFFTHPRDEASDAENEIPIVRFV